MENSKLFYRNTYNSFIKMVNESRVIFLKKIPESVTALQMQIMYNKFHDELKAKTQETFSPMNQVYEINFQPQINKINQFIEKNKSTVTFNSPVRNELINQMILNFSVFSMELNKYFVSLEKTDLVPALIERNDSMKMEKK